MPDSPPVIPIAVIAKDAQPLPEEHRTDKPMPPTTTAQEDAVTAGQRRINFIWESTQGVIALSITASFILAVFRGVASETLTNAFFFIIGTYFSRTNHNLIGGIGKKATDSQIYAGR